LFVAQREEYVQSAGKLVGRSYFLG